MSRRIFFGFGGSSASAPSAAAGFGSFGLGHVIFGSAPSVRKRGATCAQRTAHAVHV